MQIIQGATAYWGDSWHATDSWRGCRHTLQPGTFLDALSLIWRSSKKCPNHCLLRTKQDHQDLSSFGTPLFKATNRWQLCQSAASNGTALHRYYACTAHQMYSGLARLSLKGQKQEVARTRGQRHMRDKTMKLLQHPLGWKVPLPSASCFLLPFLCWSLSCQLLKHQNSSINSAFKIILFKGVHLETVTKSPTILRFIFVLR